MGLNIQKDDKGSLIFNIDDTIKYIKDELTSDIMELSKKHFVEGFPTTLSNRGGGRTNASKGGWSAREQEYNHPTLNDTGRLKNSIKIDGNSLVSNTEYGIYHNEGARNLDKREFLGESDDLNKKLEAFIIETLVNKITD